MKLCTLHQDLKPALNGCAVTHGSVDIIAQTKSPQVLRLTLQNKKRVMLRSRPKKDSTLALLLHQLTSAASIEADFCFMASCSAYNTIWGSRKGIQYNTADLETEGNGQGNHQSKDRHRTSLLVTAAARFSSSILTWATSLCRGPSSDLLASYPSGFLISQGWRANGHQA